MLRDRGAVVFDADELARRAVSPGTAGYAAVVDRFGRDVLAPGGDIDRRKLASVVFTDADARRDLESIVHPAVFRLLMEELEPYRATKRVVVFDAPLIVETGFQDACDVLVVVTAPATLRIGRLLAARGMTDEEAEARVSSQAAEDQRQQAADVVLHNDGTLSELERKVDHLWRRLAAAAD